MKSIGIDIGGTKTSIGIIDFKTGEISQKIEFLSKSYKNDKENLNKIVNNAKDLAIRNKIKHIGIGVPELIDNQGIVKGSYNFKWHNLNFKNYFDKNTKVLVDSDVRNHLRAEKLLGHGVGKENFIYINIGTGISYAHIFKNQIFNGYRGYAIHFGSSVIELNDFKKKKSFSQIPEDFYSGKAISKMLKNIKTKKHKNLYFKIISKSLASMIGNLINTIDPGFVVLGGGVILNNKEFTKKLINDSKNFIIAHDAKKMKFHISKLKKDAGLIGAGLLFKKFI